MSSGNGHRRSPGSAARRLRQRTSTEQGNDAPTTLILAEYCGLVCWFLSWIGLISAFVLAGLAVFMRDSRAAMGAGGAYLFHLLLLAIAQILALLRRIDERLDRREGEPPSS